MSDRLPNFIIIGAAKSGTTALYEYLNEHPDIFMSSIKETNYFGWDGDKGVTLDGRIPYNPFPVKTLSEYKDLFSGMTTEKLCGEASPLYLESKSAATNIKNTVPNAKIIAILRNPSERAFSGYWMHVREDREKPSIDEAFSADAHYVKGGFYYEMLKQYYDNFPEENILVLKFEDLKKDAGLLMKRVHNFIGADDTFVPDFEKRHNVGGFPKHIWLNKILTKASRSDTLKKIIPDWMVGLGRQKRRDNWSEKPEFPKDLNKKLVEIYREDVESLQKLTSLNFDDWLQV